MVRRIVRFFALLFIVNFAFVSSSYGTEDPELKEQLLGMFYEDQKHRKNWREIQKEFGNDSSEMKQLARALQKVDAENIKKLEAILAQHGWPGRSMVGEKASKAAFLVLQHSELSYQKKYIEYVRAAVANGEFSGSSLAMLEDRILMHEGKKQLYGTQIFSDEEGNLKVWPIDDPKLVDTRRASVGLTPMSDYLKNFGLEYRYPSSD